MKQLELFSTVREDMDRLQSVMHPVDGNDFVQNYFGPGIYIRQAYIPAGNMFMGKIHKEACLNILVKGTICVVSEEGKEFMAAPNIYLSGPGIRKIVWAITDTIFANVHQNPTNTEDLEELERQIIAPDFEALEVH